MRNPKNSVRPPSRFSVKAIAKNSIWSDLSQPGRVAPCDSLSEQTLALPPRSWAYHLTPMNIGTPICESLTSYVTRLSEAHCVTLRALFERKIKYEAVADKGGDNRGMVGPNSRLGTWQVNGNGVVAEKWARALEAITQRSDLRALTFLPLREGLSKRDMCRRQRAWCAFCIEAQARSNEIIYEQLLWTHKYVDVCAVHKVRLSTLCATCGRGSRVLSGRISSGRCVSCNELLGIPSAESARIETEPSEYEIFVAEQIGTLIGADPNMAFAFANQRAKQSICKFVERRFAGSVRGFTKYLGYSKALDAQLTNSRRRRFVGLKMLLTVAFVSGVTVIDLLTKDDALSEFAPELQRRPTNPGHQYPDKTAVLSALRAAAKEIPPPSLAEVATRLGLPRTRVLRSHSPQTCDLINRRYWNSERGKETRRWPRKRMRSSADIKTALEAALNSESPLSVAQVANSLGYRNDSSPKRYFPELCRALNEKRPKSYLERRKTVETELNRSLQSDPPEEPLTVAKRVGYRSTHRLRTKYSQPFKRIRDRYEAHKKAQFLSEMRTQLEAAYTQVPPPTLKDTTRKLGVSDGWLRQHFPDERRAIAVRSLRHREEQAAMNKASDRDRLKTVVRELYANGTFPSMNAVLDVFTASALKRTEVWATIREARERLELTDAGITNFIFGTSRQKA